MLRSSKSFLRFVSILRNFVTLITELFLNGTFYASEVTLFLRFAPSCNNELCCLDLVSCGFLTVTGKILLLTD